MRQERLSSTDIYTLVTEGRITAGQGADIICTRDELKQARLHASVYGWAVIVLAGLLAFLKSS